MVNYYRINFDNYGNHISVAEYFIDRSIDFIYVFESWLDSLRPCNHRDWDNGNIDRTLYENKKRYKPLKPLN